MIEVEVEDAAWTRALPAAAAVAVRAAEGALEAPFPLEGGRVGDGGVATGGEGLALEEESSASRASLEASARTPPLPASPTSRGRGVAIRLTSADAVRELNARFRGKDSPTNVLSFPAPESARPHLGDVALAYGVCAREAGEQGKSLEHHLMHLVAHGVLHLLGYDHAAEAEAERMEALERRILADLGAPDPYGEKAELDHGV